MCRGRVDGKGREGGKKKEGVKVIFWNVAGIKNKDEDFWEFLEGYDVIGLIET